VKKKKKSEKKKKKKNSFFYSFRVFCSFFLSRFLRALSFSLSLSLFAEGIVVVLSLRGALEETF